MRYRGPQVFLWCRLSRPLVRTYTAQRQAAVPPPPAAAPSGPDGKRPPELVKERVLAAVQLAGEVGRQWGQRSAQTASATVGYWWEKYEEFVGLNEVREAQTNVTEAEAAFMVARGIVREAHVGLEALEVRLKEVRDRLDRVSREEAHYLELATMEHKLLQEERRLRTAYENAEGSEREKFALFSAAVRGSHEKERTRAERTKNWSVIGSVLGALIGVMGSTYINRVRLQELKSLLLEAQKGPESLQEALVVQAGNHRSQQDELRALIDSLRVALSGAGAPQDERGPAPAPAPAPDPDRAAVSLSALKDLHDGSRRAESLLESLPPLLGRLEEGLGRAEGELVTVRRLLDAGPQTQVEPRAESPETGDRWESEAAVRRLEETQRTLGDGIRTNTIYNAAFAYTAAAITVSAVFLLLRGAG